MRLLPVLPAMLLIAGCQSSDKKTGGNVSHLQTQEDSVSYSIGINVGTNMLHDSVRYNPEALLQGIKDAALDTAQRLMKPPEVEQTLVSYQEQLRARAMETRRLLGEGNRKRSMEFLDKNKMQEGVITLPDGLQYRIIKEGAGSRPTKDDYVTAHYRGSTSDGTVFDDSHTRGEPPTFRLTGVIQGWQEVIPMMTVGSQWELFIPPDLAYGEGGSGPIGPNEALIFEFELLGIKK